MFPTLPTYAIIIAGVLISFVMFAAVLGNIFVILAFARDEKLRTAYNIYLVNLAVTDLLLGVISMPLFAVYSLNSYTWIFHQSTCTVFMTINEILLCEAVIMMIIVSFDRLRLLTQKLKYMQQQTVKRALLRILCSWIIAFILHGPVFFIFYSSEDKDNDLECKVTYHVHKLYSSVLTVTEFTVPFLCLCVINSLIFKKVRARIRAREAARNRVGNYYGVPSTSNINAMSAVVEELTNTRSLVRGTGVKKELKAAKNLALLVIVFLVTWAPYCLTYFVDTICENCVHERVTVILLWVLWSKSAMNPFLYNYMSPGFKENFKAMTKCQCKKQQS